jgi:Flp pilus assembly pilin Flp
MGCRRERKIEAWLARLLSDEEGQATVEYILILSVVIAGAGLLSRKLIEVLDSGILKLGGQLEKDLKTGRAPVGIWEN